MWDAALAHLCAPTLALVPPANHRSTCHSAAVMHTAPSVPRFPALAFVAAVGRFGGGGELGADRGGDTKQL